MGRRKQAIPIELERLRKRADQWRQNRGRLGPMPALLWREATALAHQIGAYAVARGLGLNYRRLKSRMASTTGTEKRSAEFVELSGAQILGPMIGAVVEVEDESAKLIVRLSAGAAVNAADLVSAFRRRA